MSRLIYRVQDAAGRGPYRPGFAHRWSDPEHDQRNPSLIPEIALAVRNYPKFTACGFRTLEQLQAWFSPGELQRLSKRGYFPVLMTVDRILLETASQVVFWRCQSLRNGVLQVAMKSAP